MKRKIILLCGLVIITLSSCTTKTFDEIIETKTCTLQHNFIAITTIDGSVATAEVSYLMLGENGKNIKLDLIVTTPALIGGENIKVSYDSTHLVSQGSKKSSKRVARAFRELRRDYSINGADYLTIKNTSTSTLQYCIIGNQSLHYYSPNSLGGYNFTNEKSVDFNRVIEQIPSPIYKMAPVLYLLKPELAPNCEAFAIWTKSTYNGGLISTSEVYGKLVPLLQNKIGDVTKNLPYTINEVVKLYQDEYKSGMKMLFFDYSNAERADFGVPNSNISSQNKALFGEIAPQQSLANSGQIWFINTKLGYNNVDEF